jgi:hypothetical protein
MTKVPDQASADVLLSKIELQNASLSETFRGHSFLRFLDEYQIFEPRKTDTGEKHGHYKVTAESNDPSKRTNGVKQL